MVRKSSVQLIVLAFIVAIVLVASGCAKKQMVKEEMAGKGIVTKKEEAMSPAPQTMEKPKEEASNPAAMAVKPQEETLPKEAARPVEKPFNLAASWIQFAFDDYSLSGQSEGRLKRIAEWLNKNPGTKIQIQGYTCDIGTDEYNLALGDERAESAEKYLVKMGVDSNRLSRISYGKERPRVPNTDEENRSMNRRDEFVMLK
ncbi:MAG TPA: OmpA family protein [Thermodesulfobacteriota bacterium]|nr:OmpA family protein [Thermodesulfobacteriota bacterium]